MPTMLPLLVFLGAGCGGVLRFVVGSILSSGGTITVNLLGSFAVGILGSSLERGTPAHALFIVGLLGGFTTFSAFSYETLLMFEQGALLKALLYIVSSVAGCVLLTCLGVWTGRVWG